MERGKEVLSFRNRTVVITEDYGRVIVSGNTFDLRDKIKSMDGRWNPRKRRWKIPDHSFDYVVGTLRSKFESLYDGAREQRIKDERVRAKKQRRRDGVWKSYERVAMQANYAAWDRAQYPDYGNVVDERGWQAICVRCAKPIFLHPIVKPITGCSCGCVFVD